MLRGQHYKEVTVSAIFPVGPGSNPIFTNKIKVVYRYCNEVFEFDFKQERYMRKDASAQDPNSFKQSMPCPGMKWREMYCVFCN